MWELTYGLFGGAELRIWSGSDVYYKDPRPNALIIVQASMSEATAEELWLPACSTIPSTAITAVGQNAMLRSGAL